MWHDRTGVVELEPIAGLAEPTEARLSATDGS
jgi:hypothetical protein